MKRIIPFLILLIFVVIPAYGQGVNPSFKQGYARSASQSANPHLWRGLVGAWVPELGVTGNTIHDVSGRRNPATNNGAAWTPLQGWTLDYEGGTDNITIPISNTLNFSDGTNDSPFSVCYWATMDDATNFRAISRFDSVNDTVWIFVTNPSDQLQVIIYDNDDNNRIRHLQVANVTAFEDTLTFFVATYDGRGGASAGDGITMYINTKVAPATNGTVGTYVAMENLDIDITIGRLTGIDSANGKIRSTLIYNRVLTPSEIKQLYIDSLVAFRLREFFGGLPGFIPKIFWWQ